MSHTFNNNKIKYKLRSRSLTFSSNNTLNEKYERRRRKKKERDERGHTFYTLPGNSLRYPIRFHSIMHQTSKWYRGDTPEETFESDRIKVHMKMTHRSDISTDTRGPVRCGRTFSVVERRLSA